MSLFFVCVFFFENFVFLTVASDPVPVPSGHLRVRRGRGPRRGAAGREGVPDHGPAGDADVTDSVSALFRIFIVFLSFASLFSFSPFAVALRRREERPGPQLVDAGQRPSGHAPRALVVGVRRAEGAEGAHAGPDGSGRGRGRRRRRRGGRG